MSKKNKQFVPDYRLIGLVVMAIILVVLVWIY